MNKRNRSQKQRRNSSTASESPPPLIPPMLEGNEHGAGGGNRENEANITEKEPNWTAWIQAVCAIFLVIITGFYTYYAYQQAGANLTAAIAAASAAKTAAQTLEMDRPYVSVDVVPISDLEFTPEGHGYLRLGSTVVNYGRNPALNAKIWVQFLSQAKGSPKSQTDPTAFCENLENEGNRSIESIFGGTYFPQVPYKASWIAEDQGAAGSATAKIFMPTIIACVAYQSPFSKDWLYTGKLYWIQRARHAKMGGTLLLDRGQPIPQKDLVLAPYMTPEISH